MGFTPLFDGKDLTGWASAGGGTGKWKIEDGVLTCTGPRDHLLTTRNDFGDFHLRAEVMINANGNSGIYFRTGKPLALIGDYEAQITDNPGQRYKTGSLFDLVRVSKSPVPPDTWFTLDIIAAGRRIRILVNGKETAEYTDQRMVRNTKGHIALQHHDQETQVFFRKIEIKELSAAESAAAGAFVVLGGKGVAQRKFDTLTGSGPVDEQRGHRRNPRQRAVRDRIHQDRACAHDPGRRGLQACCEAKCRGTPGARPAPGERVFLGPGRPGVPAAWPGPSRRRSLAHRPESREVAPHRQLPFPDEEHRDLPASQRGRLRAAEFGVPVPRLDFELQLGRPPARPAAGGGKLPVHGRLRVDLPKSAAEKRPRTVGPEHFPARGRSGSISNATNLDDVARDGKVLEVEASDNLFDGDFVVRFEQYQKSRILPVVEAEKTLVELLDWKGERNLFATGEPLVRLVVQTGEQKPANPVKNLAAWRTFWGTPEVDSVEGRVRYHGGDLLARCKTKPEQLTPQDWRLR